MSSFSADARSRQDDDASPREVASVDRPKLPPESEWFETVPRCADCGGVCISPFADGAPAKCESGCWSDVEKWLAAQAKAARPAKRHRHSTSDNVPSTDRVGADPVTCQTGLRARLTLSRYREWWGQCPDQIAILAACSTLCLSLFLSGLAYSRAWDPRGDGTLEDGTPSGKFSHLYERRFPPNPDFDPSTVAPQFLAPPAPVQGEPTPAPPRLGPPEPPAATAASVVAPPPAAPTPAASRISDLPLLRRIDDARGQSVLVR